MPWTDPNDPRLDDVHAEPLVVPCGICGEHVPAKSTVRPRCAACRGLPHLTQVSLTHQQRIATALEQIAETLGRIEGRYTTFLEESS